MKRKASRKILTAAVATWLVAGAPDLAAWGVKSYYPTSVDPSLPDAKQAQGLVDASPELFSVLRQAHRQSLLRGWTGASASVAGAGHELPDLDADGTHTERGR